MKIRKRGWVTEIYDVDLNTISKQEMHQIIMITATDLVVIIKNQELSHQRELELCKWCGDCHYILAPFSKHVAINEYVVRVTGEKNKDGKEGLFGHKSDLDWHCNQASNANRHSMVWLYAVKGSKGSTTSWINMRLAYEDLLPHIKEALEPQKFTCGYKVGMYTEERELFPEHHSRNEWHLVHTNEAGITGLYFPFLQIMGGFKGDLFQRLKNHVLQDKYRYDHHWEDGDVVISEQWLSVHKRHYFERMDKRLLHRIAFNYHKALL